MSEAFLPTADTPDTPGIGHNLPSEEDQFKARVMAQIETADRWINERPAVTSERMAEDLDAFIDQTLGFKKNVETVHKAAKQPHKDAADAVDAKYKPLIKALETAVKTMKQKLGVWLAAKQEKVDADRRKAEEEARAAELEARRRAAEAHDISSKMAADAAAERAKAAQRVVVRAPTKAGVRHATGRSTTTLRTHTEIKVTKVADVPVKFLRLVDAAAVEKALRGALRAGTITAETEIPGVTITQTRQAA